MIRAGRKGAARRTLIADMQRAPHPRLRRLRHRVRQLRQHAQPGEPRALRRDLGRPARGRTGRRARSDAALRPEGRHISGRSIRQRNLPRIASRPTNTATIATSAARHYSPTDLIDPISTLSGTKPELRSAAHLFVDIEKLHGFLEEWTQSGEHLQPEVANYLKGHFLGEPLRDWDVSRPAPYFGFEIPDSPGNYWYVWFDAPIGYMASTQEWCERHGEKFDDWWREPTKPEIHHFIGKDITYFHTLFWPAMLKAAGFNLPTEGSHSRLSDRRRREDVEVRRERFVRAATYLEHLDPAICAITTPRSSRRGVDDLDLNLDEFVAKVNSDLVGKVVNLASRTARFVEETGSFGKRIPTTAACSPAAAARRRIDCRRLRGAATTTAPCGDHGPGRSGQPIRRQSQAVEAAQGPGTRRRGARRLHGVAESVPATGRCTSRRSCRAWPNRPASC